MDKELRAKRLEEIEEWLDWLEDPDHTAPDFQRDALILMAQIVRAMYETGQYKKGGNS